MRVNVPQCDYNPSLALSSNPTATGRGLSAITEFKWNNVGPVGSNIYSFYVEAGLILVQCGENEKPPCLEDINAPLDIIINVVDKETFINIQVDKPEINPYPVNTDPQEPKSQIKITTENPDGTRVADTDLIVDACSFVGHEDSDGHIHDQRTSSVTCHQSQRPKATLSDGTNTGNPLSVKTDSSGEITLDYIPPFSLGDDGKKYYISGEDLIVATLERNKIVKNDDNTITTKVPDLIQMPNSRNCVSNELYYFESETNNHDCLYFGTENTNNELQKIAEKFNQTLIECKDTEDPSTEPACDVTPAGEEPGPDNFVMIPDDADPIPIQIKAMSLSWGGLLDNNGNWNKPTTTHNNGNNVDVGFESKEGRIMTVDEKRLLRDVILDSGHLLPYEGEGLEEDVSQASDHFNIEFIDCSPSTAVSSSNNNNQQQQLQTFQQSNVCQPTIKVKGKIFLQTEPGDKRGQIFVPNLKVDLCSSANNCPETIYTSTQNDIKGNFELSSNKLSKEEAKLKITFINKEKELLATQSPNVQAASILISNLPFVLDSNNNYIANTNIKIGVGSNSLFINNIPATISVSDVARANLGVLAAYYYYGEKALEFTKANLPIPLSYKMPLTISIYDSFGTSYENGINFIQVNKVDSDYIVSSSMGTSEVGQDAFFHEFGHFLKTQNNYGSGPPRDGSLSKSFLRAWLLEGNNPPDMSEGCHYGYAHPDSSCSLNEAKANFFALLLADKVNDDIAHQDYKNNAHIFKYGLGKNFFNNLDWENSKFKIAGIPSNPISSIFPKWPFFKHAFLSEEFALTSLLWDLYDSENPSEFLDVDSLALVRETVSIPLHDFTNTVLPARTTSDVYMRLKQLGYFNVNIDAIFAANGVCIDSNFNGKCSTLEVINGLSAWSVALKGKKSFIYGYPPVAPRP